MDLSFLRPDIFNPRPDWAFHEAGALALRPDDFPFSLMWVGRHTMTQQNWSPTSRSQCATK